MILSTNTVEGVAANTAREQWTLLKPAPEKSVSTSSVKGDARINTDCFQE